MALVTERGVPESQTYTADSGTQRTLVWCRNPECEFCARRSNSQGLPVVVVDDEIYRTCPSLIVATVDKFARLPFKGETRSLFGFRNRFSATYGHITEAHGDFVGGRKLKDAVAAPRLLPPELIIQDELHLISGPLGTMVGLYEAAVEYASGVPGPADTRIPAKVIASTATIRRAAQQARQLFARKLAIFPPSGLSGRDSFFARELPIDQDMDSSAGRLRHCSQTLKRSCRPMRVPRIRTEPWSATSIACAPWEARSGWLKTMSSLSDCGTSLINADYRAGIFQILRSSRVEWNRGRYRHCSRNWTIPSLEASAIGRSMFFSQRT